MNQLLLKIITKLRYLTLLLSIKFSDDNTCRKKLVTGDLFALTGDEISLSLCVYKNFENLNRKYWESLIRPGFSIMDVGANWGVYSVAARRLVGCEGKVFVFEPNPIEFKKLEKNMALNFGDVSNVVMTEKAVGDNLKMIEFYQPPLFKGAYGSLAKPKIVEECNTLQVEMTTLDHFVSENGIENLDVLKIDVEGAEIKVLEGAKRLLENFHPVILIEVSDKRTEAFGYKATGICQYLLNIGYELFLPVEGRDKSSVELVSFSPTPDIHYVDVVAIFPN